MTAYNEINLAADAIKILSDAAEVSPRDILEGLVGICFSEEECEAILLVTIHLNEIEKANKSHINS